MTKQEFLAMSLPYGLKILRPDNKTILEIAGIVGNLYIFNDNGVEKYGAIKCISNKPIFHPLSDLTKEIEHKGERFVPIERIKELNLGTMPKNNTIGWMYYQQVQKLIEWHFDIADLISKGEAIDVNTLEINPYK